MMRHHGDGQYQREVEYEDYDEYEEEFSEQEEEEPEAPKLTKEEQDFLKLRERLKERAKKNLKKEISHDFGRSSQSQDRSRIIRKDTFGSFFGPSQPVIASRVLEESRSIRETKHILANVYNKKESTSSGAKTNVHHQSNAHHQSSAHHQQRKVVNEVKKKAQTLKDMRDYSFLLSDDADFPTPSKEQPTQRKVSAHVEDRRLAQLPPKSKASASKPTTVASSSQELRNPSSSARALQNNKARILKDVPTSRTVPSSNESRKVSGGSVRHEPTKNAVSKSAPNKAPAQIIRGNRPPSNANIPNSKKIISSIKPKPSVPHQYPQQKRPNQVPAQSRPTPKQPLPSLKPQPSKQNPSRAIPDEGSKKRPFDRNSSDEDRNNRPRKRPPPRNFDDEEEVDYRSLIRGMFGYNPNKYAGMDDDDSDMEVGFDNIMKEERISSKIAKKEDEEQLRLIEEEEERERRRKMMKKKMKQ